MTTRRTIKYRYLKTKMALNQTVQSILNINKRRRFYKDDDQGRQALDEELKVLNAVAENHARVLRNYELQLRTVEQTLPVQTSPAFPNTTFLSK